MNKPVSNNFTAQALRPYYLKNSFSEHMLTDQQAPETPPTPDHHVAIYCGSRSGSNPIYEQETKLLTAHLVKHHFGIVYGGGTVGLMGAVAKQALALGGHVIGIIPEFLIKKELAAFNLSELMVVETMHQRKALMAERAQAFVTLPGGLGTLEEIMEVACWAQLDHHQKPMILFNINNYYQHLVAQLDHAVEEGFLSQQHRANIHVCNQPHEIIEIIGQSVQQFTPAA